MSIFLISVVISTTHAIGAPQLYDQDIKHAMDIIANKIEARHEDNLCWESTEQYSGWLAKHDGGTTAIATLALLSAGKSTSAPKLQESLDYLWNIENPSTYVLAIRTSIWAMLPEKFNSRLKHDTKRLVATMSLSAGGWGNYAQPPQSLTNSSPLVREFGMIALREAGRRGERIPIRCWAAIANVTLGTQHKNGGWAYEQGATRGKVTANMTVAGLNCLLGVDEVYGADLNEKDAKLLHQGIDRAIAWLNKHATTSKNSGGTALMSYLYALERAAMTCGLAEIRNHDWFMDGARAVIDSHCGVRIAKGSTVNLSFALLFLSRGRVPIALCELVKDKGHVDPMRVSHTIANRISLVTEQALGWQLVTNEDSWKTWLSAPLLFIQNISVVPEDHSKLKQYLDNGGTLLMLATGKEHGECVELARSLCPNIQSEHYRREYWTHELLGKLSGIQLTSWHDGVRDRILLIKNTSKKLVESDKSKVSKLCITVCCGVAELNRWKPRLGSAPPEITNDSIVLAQHDGAWDLDSAGLHRWKLKSKSLSKSSGKPLVLVGGIYQEEATEELTDMILTVASSGSTVVVESIGGRGNFAKAIRKHVANKTDDIMQPDQRMKTLLGKRGWSIKNHQRIDIPLVINVGKGKIMFVNFDFRNALLGQSAWGIHGYDTNSAIEFIEILLCQ